MKSVAKPVTLITLTQQELKTVASFCKHIKPLLNLTATDLLQKVETIITGNISLSYTQPYKPFKPRKATRQELLKKFSLYDPAKQNKRRSGPKK